jgi:polyisoprenyl-phosphate glycosyltransferase
VAYDRRTRLAGKSKYPPGKMLALALEGITSFSVKPLRLITLTGVMLFVFSLLLGSWAIAVRLLGYAYVPGWTSILVATSFIGGMQLLSLGVLGEYLGKIYLETKQRPRFIIDKCVGPVYASGAAIAGEDDLTPAAAHSSKKVQVLA